jgi:DNA-binding transcriptional MerR regulator
MSEQQPAKLFTARPARLFTIGQVLNILDPEFPDLSTSKLRFLEEQGLVTPQRTASGYRKFSEHDVERIRIILELQRTRFLPLKVIGNYLDELDEGKAPVLPSGGDAPAPVMRQLRARKLTALELTAQTSISDKLIAEAQELKLLPEEPFDHSAIEIAKALVNLQRFGISPRHLRGLKASADREIGIIEGVIAPILGKNETVSRSKAAHYAREMEQQFATIRAEIINAAINQIEN